MYSDGMDTPANPQLTQNLKIPTESVGTEGRPGQPQSPVDQANAAAANTAQDTAQDPRAAAPYAESGATPDPQATSQASQPTTAEQSPVFPGIQKPIPEELVFEWQAPSRPFKNRNRQYYTTIGLIGGLIGLILIFAGQMLPVAVLLTALFLIYILNTVPPHIITNKITTYGIRVEDTLYYWEEMGRFWMTKIHDDEVLNIEVARFPFHLKILLSEEMSVEGTTEVLSEILVNEQPPPTTYEKAAEWLHKKIPIDLES